jgi:hypothetical protein
MLKKGIVRIASCGSGSVSKLVLRAADSEQRPQEAICFIFQHPVESRVFLGVGYAQS